MIAPRDGIEHLVIQAQAGDRAALDRVLGLYRNYLHLLARTQIDMKLARHLSPSDAVQETLLRAFRNFPQFRGATEGELLGWLRRILARTLADQLRKARTHKRDVGREYAFQSQCDASSQQLARLAAAADASPSELASRREQSVLLADALSRLPADYREVIVLRHLERVAFSEIARRMDRSSGAVRMLWARALERLRQEMDAPP